MDRRRDRELLLAPKFGGRRLKPEEPLRRNFLRRDGGGRLRRARRLGAAITPGGESDKEVSSQEGAELTIDTPTSPPVYGVEKEIASGTFSAASSLTIS